MILKIKETGKIITKDLKIADSFINRMLGLLIKSNPRSLLFKTRFGIHTLFLNEPIDVLILNKNFKIIKIKSDVKPNNLIFWNPVYPYVIELPYGTIMKFNLRQAQTLVIC